LKSDVFTIENDLIVDEDKRASEQKTREQDGAQIGLNNGKRSQPDLADITISAFQRKTD
jgi:hypothetical protein